MFSSKAMPIERRVVSLVVLLILVTSTLWSVTGARQQNLDKSTSLTLHLSKPWSRSITLSKSETLEISVGLPRGSALPVNGRIGVTWTSKQSAKASWSKTLHALDPDVYVVYRVPEDGEYSLEIAPVMDGPAVFEGARWREDGIAPQAVTFPTHTPWPPGKVVPLHVSIDPIEQPDGKSRMQIETEPNDTPEMAQEIRLPSVSAAEEIAPIRITGGADDIEYFDNGKGGNSGDEWFRLVFDEKETRLLTCNLMIPDHTIAAQLRFYSKDKKGALVEYTEGRNENERTHQQNEQHRSAITRLLKPGRTYFLRAEANAPGYEIELRVLKPAPYSDPRMAVRE